MRTLSKQIIYSIELSVIILGCLLFACYYNIKRANTREMWVKHTDKVLLHNSKIQLSASESELQARNFMLTGYDSFIKQFRISSATSLSELDSLKRLTADNPHSILVIDSVNFYIVKRIGFSMAIIKLRQEKGIGAAVALIQSGEGNTYLTKSNYYIRMIERQEDKLMSERKERSKKAQTIMNTSLLVTVSFILLMLVILVKKSKKDFAEREAMVKKLITNSNRMRTAEKLASLGIWTMDIDTMTLNASDEMYRMWGYEAAQTGSTAANFMLKVHPDDQQLIREKAKNLTIQSGTDSFIFRLIDNDTVKYISTGITVVRSDNQELLSITGYVQDITEKTRDAAKLDDANQKLTVIFNKLGEVIFSRDMIKDRFLHISDNCETMFGYTPADFEADPMLWITCMHPDDQHLVEHGNALLAAGVQIANQYRIICKDTTIKWVENKIIPTLDDDDVLICIDAVISDITEKKLASLEREQIMADLLQRNTTLEQFTYIVSHNLRAPVANIIGLSGILEIMDISSDEQHGIVNDILSSVNKLDYVVRDLNRVLEVREQANEKRTTIYLHDLVADVKTSLQQVISQKNIHIRCNFIQAGHLFSIRDYLHSIFYNLFLNSIKFCREDITTLVSVETIRTPTHIELLFKDNGKGIDLEKNGPTLFGLYRRFDFSVEGKGMGLFMVKTQVEALGGTIHVKSSLNNGTEFRIILPNSAPQPAETKPVYAA